jgi:hypothetical protein
LPKKLLKIFCLVFFSIQLISCSSDENEITIYLIERKIYSPLRDKKDSFEAIKPVKFIIWENAKIVYAEAPSFDWIELPGFKNRLINKNCIVNDKNNWCCYGDWITQADLYKWHLMPRQLLIENSGRNLEQTSACHYGMINGKLMTLQKYFDNNTTDKSFLYSVPYWKWRLYKHKVLIK